MAKSKLCRRHKGRHAHADQTKAVAHCISARRDLGHDLYTYKCAGCGRWFAAPTKLGKTERLLRAIDKAVGK
jgi:hypothetical protein